jgi:hypothetical protein
MSKKKAKAKKRRKERKELRYCATHDMPKVKENENAQGKLVVQ